MDVYRVLRIYDRDPARSNVWVEPTANESSLKDLFGFCYRFEINVKDCTDFFSGSWEFE